MARDVIAALRRHASPLMHHAADEIERLRAVNADLLDALEELVKRVPFTPAPNGITAHISLEQIAQARAAIERATP